jgi:hypothetical protein
MLNFYYPDVPQDENCNENNCSKKVFMEEIKIGRIEIRNYSKS